DDTATVVAAPLLPLLLLAAERHLERGAWRDLAALAASLARLLVAGSPEAAGAGVFLLALRLAAGHLGRATARPAASLVAIAAAILVAAPQLVPTAFAVAQAGDWEIAPPPGSLPGMTGLVLRYASHTPAPALALVALPLAFTHPAARAAGAALLLSFLLAARGRLAVAGPFTLA